jgi:hypothetical protein
MSDTQQQESQTILAFEGFTGLNTNASRPGIKDSELSWCDGFMPLGDSNLRTLPGIGPGIFPAPSGTTIKFYDFGNIATTPLMIVFPSDGSIWQVNTTTLVATRMAPPATITNVARNAVGITQWGNAAIIVVAQQANGYFVLDGTLFYQAGTLAPFDASQLTSGGSAYTSLPIYTVYGGSGSGVTLTPVLTNGSITDLIITNAGTGYLPGDIVQVGFSGGGSDTTPILQAVLATGVVQYLTLVSGGSGFPTGTFALGFSGGGGSGAIGTFTTSGGVVQSVLLTGGGANYTGSPTVSFPISGSGAAITATESGGAVNSLTIVTGGSGYVPGTYPLAFSGGGGTGASATYTVNPSGVVASTTITAGGTGYTSGPTVTIPTGGGAVAIAAITPGAIVSVNIIQGGTNLTGTPLLTVVGGGGSGAALTAVLTSGSITGVTVTNGGTGFTSVPAIEVQAGFNNAASAILSVMPFGISGASAETYQSRVWVANPFSTNPQGAGGTVNFTAPGSYTDFATADGGGSFTSNDSFLRVAYVGLIQTNGFLYLIGDSSVNYIGGVTTSGNPPQTSFTNQNADPETGSPYPGTMDVIGSNIVFANAFGAHVSYGGRVAKISEPLDGFYSSVPNQFGGFPLSAAKAIVYGKRIWALLVPVIDQFTELQVNKLCMWNPDRKAWWTTQQDVALTYVNTQEIASVETAYGTDGTNVYPLFTTPSVAFQKVAQSKLWAKPGGYMHEKTANRVWLVAQYFSGLSPGITFDTDNDADQPSSVVLTPTLASPPVGFYVSPPTASSQVGTLLGVTLVTSAADVALISAAIDSIDAGFRG